jgi:hypothetical protein
MDSILDLITFEGTWSIVLSERELANGSLSQVWKAMIASLNVSDMTLSEVGQEGREWNQKHFLLQDECVQLLDLGWMSYHLPGSNRVKPGSLKNPSLERRSWI